jgi:hypothetical protein
MPTAIDRLPDPSLVAPSNASLADYVAAGSLGMGFGSFAIVG